MKALPGGRLVLGFSALGTVPGGGAVPLNFTSVDFPLAAVGAGNCSAFGAAVVSQSAMVRPVGWVSMEYPPWINQSPVLQRSGLHLGVVGIDPPVVPSPIYVRWRQYVLAPGLSPSDVPIVALRLAGGYQPAPGSNIVLSFLERLAPPPGSAVVLEFGAEGYTKVLSVTLGATAAFGALSVKAPYQTKPTGFVSSAVGVPQVEGEVRYVSLSDGIHAPPAGTPLVQKAAAAILPGGMASAVYGTATSWNYRQYVRASGSDMGAFGFPNIKGGVKVTSPIGFDSLLFGLPQAGSKYILPSGFIASAVPGPAVSPRIVFPTGFSMLMMGVGGVQRNPGPFGWESLFITYPVVEFKTRRPAVDPIAAPDLGYPRVFDPTRAIYPATVQEVGIFGDSSIQNQNLRIDVAGFYAQQSGSWATVYSNRRTLQARGLDFLAVGNPVGFNKSPSIQPEGLDYLALGQDLSIGAKIRVIEPSGTPELPVGVPSIVSTPQLFPVGGAPTSAGEPTVWYRVRLAQMDGFDAKVLGKPTASFRYRQCQSSGWDSEGFGNHVIEPVNRHVAGLGSVSMAFGNPYAGFKTRSLYATGVSAIFASAHMVGGRRFLSPTGWDAAQFGDRVIPEIQTVYPLGFSELFGTPASQNRTSLLNPAGFSTGGAQPADRWGTAALHNSRQIITMFYDPDSGLNVPSWSAWTLVENKNRHVGAVGDDLAKFGRTGVTNGARPVLPAGFDALSVGICMTAYRVRSIRPEAIEAPYIGQWSTAFNAARVLLAAGFYSTQWGYPLTEKTRRYFDRIGGMDTAAFGDHMTAYRVRGIDIESRYGIDAPQIDLPQVQLYTRYVSGKGLDALGVGWASLEIHKTIVTPRWVAKDRVGEPRVFNVTPELQTYGRAADEFGNSLVRLQYRYVPATGDNSELFGYSSISFRDRSVKAQGFLSFRFGPSIDVANTGAPPYSLQSITLDRPEVVGVKPEGDGITVPENQVPSPALRIVEIQHIQKSESAAFGVPTIAANSIRVSPGYFSLLVGEPSVTARVRMVFVSAWEVEDVPIPEKCRVSPHTIWATPDAPKQAVSNHQGKVFSPIVEAAFGIHDVSNYNRRVRAAGSDFLLFGVPGVDLSKKYVYPDAFSSFRTGWHAIPGKRTLVQFDGSFDEGFGTATASVIVVGPLHIKPSGFLSGNSGELIAQLKNRNVLHKGFLSFLAGGPVGNDSPYMWQGLRVGPLMPTIPEGFDASQLSDPSVSFFVRGVQPEGYDAFLCTYDVQSFRDRMKVTRKDIPKPSLIVRPVGFSDFMCTASDVRLKVHYIRPDGNSEQFRKGGQDAKHNT